MGDFRQQWDHVALQAQNEVAVLASLDHPNVVKYYECFAERGTQVKIVMELCQVRLEIVKDASFACCFDPGIVAALAKLRDCHQLATAGWGSRWFPESSRQQTSL